MPTARPFAINTGAATTGTVKTGNIASVIPAYINGFDFAATGLKWYNGPDEAVNLEFGFTNPGYIICFQGTSKATPDGTSSTLNFLRSGALTDQSFIDLAAKTAGQSFANTTAAASWLSSNNYYTTFAVPVGTQFGYTYISGSSYPMSSLGSSTIIIDNPTAIDKYIWLSGNSTYLTSGTNTGSAASSGLTGSPISMSNTITGSSQVFENSSYIFIPAYTLNSQFTITNTGTAGSAMRLVYTDTNTPTKTNLPQL